MSSLRCESNSYAQQKYYFVIYVKSLSIRSYSECSNIVTCKNPTGNHTSASARGHETYELFLPQCGERWMSWSPIPSSGSTTH